MPGSALKNKSRPAVSSDPRKIYLRFRERELFGQPQFSLRQVVLKKLATFWFGIRSRDDILIVIIILIVTF